LTGRGAVDRALLSVDASPQAGGDQLIWGAQLSTMAGAIATLQPSGRLVETSDQSDQSSSRALPYFWRTADDRDARGVRLSAVPV